MASFAPFILKHKNDMHVNALVKDCMSAFIRRSLSRYRTSTQVGVVGSFGCACKDMLKEEGKEYGLEFVKFLKSPIDELVKYHSYGI